MTDDQISNVWRQYVLPVYVKNPRNRNYAVTPESRRQLVALYRACRDSSDSTDQAQDLFAWAMNQFAEAGVNVLQPLPRDELHPPEMERDIFGNPLPNPFVTNDLQGQSILQTRNPRLATLCKQIAESPWKAWADWQDRCTANLKKRGFKYDADTHKTNFYVTGFTNETERGRFEREHTDVVEQLKAEAHPVGFPVGKEFNLTLQSKIARTPKLAALFDGMRRHEQQVITEARMAAQEQRAKAEAELKKLEAASK